MWRWYRNSRVCYTYLNDVSTNTDATARDTALAESKWFTRGWTLQELLAPSKLVIYDTTWQRIGTREELAGEITKITKIDASYLSSDTSRITDASVAEKMSWASMRQTKKIEDVAYSLLGIFDVNMPLLYGEGAKAFHRLQGEIMKQSDDQSIFTWSQSSIEQDSGVMLAPSPAHFKNCGDIVRSVNTRATKPYAMTNIGLQAEFPVLGRGEEMIVVLNCRYGHDVFCDLGIWLCRDDKSNYRRGSRPLEKFPITHWSRGRLQKMYVKNAPGSLPSRSSPGNDSCVIRKLPENYMVVGVYPPCPPLHATCLNTGCIQVQVGKEDMSFASRTVVLIKPQSPKDSTEIPAILIIIFNRGELHHQIIDACILPIPMGEDIDEATVYSEWENHDLASLPRVKSFDTGTVVLHITSGQVRSHHIAIVDVSISSHRLRLAEEKMIKVLTSISRSRATSYIRSHPTLMIRYVSFFISICLLISMCLIIEHDLTKSEQLREWVSIDKSMALLTVIMIPINLVVGEHENKILYHEKLQAWVNSRHRGSLHVIRDIRIQLPLLTLTSCTIYVMCDILSVSGVFTILTIVAAMYPTFFALQILRWGNWI
jgi:hypothetical protein